MSGCVSVRLDDFYRDADDPGLPHWGGIVDWDDPGSWNGEAAATAIRTLIDEGRVHVPVYDISLSRRVGEHELHLPEPSPGERVCIVAEGIFAPELVRRCRDLGIDTTGVWLTRPRLLVFWLRLVRDLKDHRKPPLILLRRGWTLLLKEPEQRRGCRREGLRGPVDGTGRLPDRRPAPALTWPGMATSFRGRQSPGRLPV